MNDYLSALGLALQERVPLGGKTSLSSEENSYGVVLFSRPGGFETFCAFGDGGVSIMPYYWVPDKSEQSCIPKARELWRVLEQSIKCVLEKQKETKK